MSTSHEGWLEGAVPQKIWLALEEAKDDLAHGHETGGVLVASLADRPAVGGSRSRTC